ncbi:MAG: efflux RND transporter periplasmic adaptor subunit [Rubripirellula sp.]
MNRFFPWIAVLALILVSPANGNEVESFLEPYRSAAVSAPETGVIEDILVVEGERVVRGQSCAKLNDSVLRASLRVALAAKEAKGALLSAQADASTRENQLASYRDLHERGNATRRELDRAESEYQQAAARLQNVREDLEVRRREHERVEAQIEQRKITSPFDGIVVAIEKEVGEYVSPTDPVVLRIVHLDTLKADFSIPLHLADSLRKGQSLRLRVGAKQAICGGVVEYVSPVAEAKSTTVRVSVRVANGEGKIQSGIPCQWDLRFQQPISKSSQQPNNRVTRYSRTRWRIPCLIEQKMPARASTQAMPSSAKTRVTWMCVFGSPTGNFADSLRSSNS